MQPPSCGCLRSAACCSRTSRFRSLSPSPSLWRYRDAVWPSAAALGLAVSAKLLLWPMYVWMLATRRLRAAALSVVIGLAVTLGAWAVIGFAGFVDYPDLLRRLSEIQSERSYSFVGIASELGLPSLVGQALMLAVGGALLVVCFLYARGGDEVRSFTCAVAATLALSPIVWLHYLVVLLVPLAIARPRFSLLWLLPALLWLSPKPGYAEGVQTIFPAIAAAILVVILLARPRRERRARHRSTGVSASHVRQRMDWWRVLTTGGLLAAASILVAALFTGLGSGELGWDFRVAYLPAAEAVLDGTSPYPPDPNAPALDVRSVYAYPPQLAVFLAPLAVLPVDVAVVLAFLASLAALMAAIYLVGVRDIRCFAVVPIWASSWNALEMANLSAALALLLALVWRYRSHFVPLAAALGTMVALKLFLWPLLVWAAVTGRVRGSVAAVVIGAATTLAAWAVIGFAGLREYPDLLARIEGQESYSVAGMAGALGLGVGAGRALTFLAGGLLLAVCVTLARRGDERRAFIVAVGSALALSPVLWLHYLALLAVPLGLARPRFSPVWLLPIVLWVAPRSENGDGLEPFLPALVALILLFVLVVRPRERPRLSEVPV